mmetsp:Transcript_13008/g.12870  ORF Transcript_13008/g.12870 Transcript_13008/m.12870 type:complete len:93 (-) Transcript_13008:1362-1640(-)
MHTYFHNQGMNVFEYLPITYMLTIPEGKYSNLDTSLRKFQKCFDLLDHFRYQVVEINKSKANGALPTKDDEFLSFRKIEQLVDQKYAHRNLF